MAGGRTTTPRVERRRMESLHVLDFASRMHFDESARCPLAVEAPVESGRQSLRLLWTTGQDETNCRELQQLLCQLLPRITVVSEERELVYPVGGLAYSIFLTSVEQSFSWRRWS